ncbi:hypothetical protein CANARDRAFT_51531 [[Candida] arabinofermentans NRRL YB-2248]|uniref:Sec1-like protein n=1 Tax=[Candida] arabinofermentans NRRL YB-2248 TaxID=983967 RepID=A0A1E4T7M9_9ASCO|nr:hypothetical protein CANARDRAFT_51531 [[Candida] arabinofermentans NRRL YB-2248]
MSLFDLQKQELVKKLNQYQSNFRHLIVDDTIYPLVKQLLKDDVLNYVFTFYKIDDPERSTNRDKAIYLLDPTRSYTIDCLMSEFSRGKRYESSVICFMPGLTKIDADKLLSNKYLFNSCGGKFDKIEFLSCSPIYSRSYVTGCHYSIPAYFNSTKLGRDLTEHQINKAVESMLSLCILTNEYPVVRYYNSPVSKAIASQFQMKLDEYYRRNPDLTPAASKTVFFVADRTMDFMSPFSHFQYYSSQIFDLMDKYIERERGTYIYKYRYEVDTKQGRETKFLQFDQNDNLFIDMKDLTVPEYSKVIMDHYRELQAEDTKFSKLTYGSDIAHAALTQSDHLAKRQAVVGHYKLIKRIEQCFTNEEDVGDCMAFEGQIATNLSSDKEYFDPVTDALIQCFLNPKIDMSNRIRLLIIYAFYRGGIIEADLKKLCMLGLPDKIESITRLFKNFELLHLNLLKPSLDVKGYRREIFHDIKNTDNLTERYIPTLCNLVSRLASNKLPEVLHKETESELAEGEPIKDFPYVKGAPIDEEEKTYMQPVRNQPKWKSTKQSSNDITKQKLLIFFAGGLTHSELSMISSCESKANKNIFIGTDELYTTTDLIGDIALINDERKDAGFPLDLKSLKKPVPSFIAENSAPPAPKAPVVNKSSAQSTPQQKPLAQQKQSLNQNHTSHQTPSSSSSSNSQTTSNSKDGRKRDKMFKKFKGLGL